VPLHAVRTWQSPSNWNGVDAARWRQETAEEARAELRKAFALVPTPELAATGRFGALARRLRRETEEYVYAQNAMELPES